MKKEITELELAPFCWSLVMAMGAGILLQSSLNFPWETQALLRLGVAFVSGVVLMLALYLLLAALTKIVIKLETGKDIPMKRFLRGRASFRQAVREAYAIDELDCEK